MKPPKMERALARAAAARWAAGKAQRTLDIRRMTTAARESTEDYQEAECARYIAEMESQIRIMCAVYGIRF